MAPRYPNDADGNTLKNLAAEGNDMSAKMLIEFQAVVAEKAAAKWLVSELSKGGIKVEISKQEMSEGWDVVVSCNIVPTYQRIVKVQRVLTEWATELGGYCDGWGTLGNKPVKANKAKKKAAKNSRRRAGK